MSGRKKRRSQLPRLLIGISMITIISLIIFQGMSIIAKNAFGEPNQSLSSWQRFTFGLQLIVNSSELLVPLNSTAEDQLFVIESGENAHNISERLEQMRLIPNAKIFNIYLAWTGMDTNIQVGTYRINPAMSAEEIANMLQSTSLADILFVVLPGWRMEEVASSLQTSGLNISYNDFLIAAQNFQAFPKIIPAGKSIEGFLFPGPYVLPRSTTADQLISALVQSFQANLPEEYSLRYYEQGLDIYQAVTLASIIEREAIVDDEMPLIASVFYNRLSIGMKLQSDPTVQYAIGYNISQGLWWTNPLMAVDLQYPSLYNTYLHMGLPPGPIANPGLSALAAVAHPLQSNYFFFQARCDNSGLHNFAETFEQHEANYCP